MGDENQFQEEEQDESYSFLNETVKERPKSIKWILTKAAEIILSACLFGAVAAFVFLRITGGGSAGKSSGKVVIEKDVDSTAPTAAPTPTETPEVTETPEPTDTPTPIPTATPTPTPTPEPEEPEEEPELTEEELEEQALEGFRLRSEAMKKISAEALKSVVTVTALTSTEDWFSNIATSSLNASGLLIADTGTNLIVMTDLQIPDEAEKLLLTFPGGNIESAELIKTDPVTGFSALSVSKEELPEDLEDTWKIAVLGNSYGISSGDSVIAIGNLLGYSGSVANGEITSLGNKVSLTDREYELIITNIQGSDTGSGVLVNLDGDIVGCIAQRFAGEETSVVTALPISLVKTLIETLSNNSALSYIGISGSDVTEEISFETDIPVGVYVNTVDPDSPALTAGIQPGDVIVRNGEISVTNMHYLHSLIESSLPGTELPLTVMRKGAEGYVEFEFTIIVGELQ